MLQYEQKYWQSGRKYLAGIDEAGRGPLAGPVAAAAVILPQNIDLPEVTDSKKISEKKRERLFDDIYKTAISIGVGVVHEEVIDNKNILQATYQAMRHSLGQLSISPEVILVDGNKADIKHYKQESIIDGDQKSLSIAAASIIAKVTRDRMMRQFDIVFPEYGFAKHKGYGTKQHIEAIQKSKATPIHRKSFNPVSHHLPNMAYLQRNRLLGKLGEQLTACQLIRNHQNILEMNYNVPKIGEIDIISKDAEILVFTEVKTQTTAHDWGTPRSQIDEKKRDRIMNAVQHYMDSHELDCDFRFDVAEVILGSGKPQIQIIKDGMTGY
ncbi:uncharacterized protein METZ01_LOCUS301130 [marine metagenome]|uniref:Ribonuclease HII n=1 Tax=marine metagenome TaxID=408172 RepID=A0A382MHP9_9ZZZZ